MWLHLVLGEVGFGDLVLGGRTWCHVVELVLGMLELVLRKLDLVLGVVGVGAE